MASQNESQGSVWKIGDPETDGGQRKKPPFRYMPTMSNMEVPEVTLPEDVAKSTKPIEFTETSRTIAPTKKGSQKVIETSMSEEGKQPNSPSKTEGSINKKPPKPEGGSTNKISIPEGSTRRQSRRLTRTPTVGSQDEPPDEDERLERERLDSTLKVIVAYWQQHLEDTESYRKTLTKQQIKDYVETVLQVRSVEIFNYIELEDY